MMKAVDIGSRLELLVDDSLIASMTGGAELRQHHPVPQEVAIVHDEAWEGSGGNYHSIFQDGNVYRMYYHGWQLSVSEGKLDLPHELVTCYAESDDGTHWRKPELGLFEFNGSKKNNIVLVSGEMGAVKICAGHIAMFKDENPNCAHEALYKAMIFSPNPHGLLPFKSPDGIHWSPMSDTPVITRGDFDSQNLAFWDTVRNEYRAYFRYFTGGTMGDGLRDIRTATSDDFLHWSDPVDLQYPGAPPEQLYTNQIKPYHRAPHIFIGFPARYVERGWSDSMRALPDLEHRQLRSSAQDRYGMALTEGLMMTSRDGVNFKRWGEAFLRPGPERPGTWHYGHQYIGWHLVETEPSVAGAPRELSLFATEDYWTGTSSQLRRYALRMDGFVSVNAPLSGGEFVTKPLIFDGSELLLNFSTSAAGSIRMEIQDAAGAPLPGFDLEDCPEVFGDSIEREVRWKNPASLHSLSGKPVRLRIHLRDADLYALRFAL